MIATIKIKGKWLDISVRDGHIGEIHLEGRLVDGRTSNPDSDFVEAHDSEIVEAVEDWIEADKQEKLVDSLPY